jgi:iron(III) transport system substrate-binding protein
MTKMLKIYSGRNRPDLAPVYRLFEQLTDTSIQVEKVYHWDVEGRVVDESADPQADILLTNSQLALQLVEDAQIFEPYAAPVAREYAEWLHAPDYSWLSFTAWPRVAMINRRVLGHGSTVWPTQLEDFARPDFKGKLGCASMLEATTIAQFAAIRVARGDAYAEDLLDRLCANGLRVYPSNLDTRLALVNENLAAVLANSSNVHVFYMEGQPVGEAWLDQEDGSLGTHVEAHTLAILKGCKHPEQARDFIDFLLGSETQSLLARLYGETPVNPNAEHGWVRPLAAIRRTDAPLKQIASAFDSTRKLLQSRGFGAPATSVLGGQDGR